LDDETLFAFRCIDRVVGLGLRRRLQVDRCAGQGAVRRSAAGWRARGSGRIVGTHAASARVAAPNTAQSAPAARVAAAPTSKDLDDKKAVDQDVAQTRDKQCTDAQERYKKLIEGRRLYKNGPDGERQYMTSEQIDTERLNAKRDIDNTCNSPT